MTELARVDWASLESGWTSEILTDEQVQTFIEGVIWPAIDYLYESDGHDGNFRLVAELDEGFCLQVNPGDSINLNLGANCVYGEYDPMDGKMPDTVHTVGILIQEKVENLKAEELVLTENGRDQLWTNSGYLFIGGDSELVAVQDSRIVKSGESGRLITLAETERKQTNRSVLTREDCLKIANVFVELGVPETTLNALMDYEVFEATLLTP